MKCIVIICFIFLPIGCNKQEINFDFLSNKSQVDNIPVIEGSILSIYGHQFVRLTKPINHDSNISYNPISNASIFLFDGINTYNYVETEILGEYLSIDSFCGVPGREYCITVEIEGNSYKACDIMKKNDDFYILPINEITSGNSDRIFTSNYIHNFGYVENNIWILNHHFDSLGSPRLYLSPYDITTYPIMLYTHTSAIPQGIFPNGVSSTGGAGEPDEYAEYIQLSISDNYYKYLISMFNLTYWSSGMFSTIPGNTYTNVSEGGTGYFFASDVKKIRVQYKDLKALNN